MGLNSELMVRQMHERVVGTVAKDTVHVLIGKGSAFV